MRWRRVATVVALAGVASCGASGPTAARVFFDLEPGVSIDQVRLQADLAGVQLLSLDVPKVPGGELTQRQDVVILFEDRLGGSKMTFLAAGLLAGAEVARGQTDVTVAAGKTVETFVTLRPGAGCPAGQHQCTDACYPDDDTGHCGLSCLTCTALAHGRATCVSGSCSFTCDKDFTRCGSECVDPKTDARNCSACARSCEPNQICLAGACVLNTCPSGQHACYGTCVPNLDPATCGTRCEPCPVPANGSATCDGSTCDVTCGAGYQVCSGSCASNTSAATCGTRCTPCPTVPNTDASCNGTVCTYTCKVGYHSCGNACVSNSDPDTCGDSCTPCPDPPDHAIVACDGTSCSYSCNAGYHDCGTWCQIDGQACTACPPCGTGQYCYPPAGVCYTPGQCTESLECVSGVCEGTHCTCSMTAPPQNGCRPHEQCFFTFCVPEP